MNKFYALGFELHIFAAFGGRFGDFMRGLFNFHLQKSGNAKRMFG